MAGQGMDVLAVRILEGLGRQLWGFPPRLMAAIVAGMGGVAALRWFARHMPRYEHTRHVLGPMRTHLACTVISLHNGCRYCAFGHAYAVELIYLKAHGRLFPIDARELAEWVGLEPAELRHRMIDLLQQADLHGEVLWVDRTLAMTGDAQRPVDRDEARIAHLVAMFEVLNSVGMTHAVAPDEAHDPVNKDGALKARNSQLRQATA